MSNWTQLFVDNDFQIPIAEDQFSILCPFHEDTVQSCAINLLRSMDLFRRMWPRKFV